MGAEVPIVTDLAPEPAAAPVDQGP
jgi:hypothetical protein